MVKRYFRKIFSALSSDPKSPVEVSEAARPLADKSNRPTAPKSLTEHAEAVLGFEVEACPGAQAFARWKEIKAAGAAYPVIIGPEPELRHLIDPFETQVSGPDESVDDSAFDFPRKFIDHIEADHAEFNEDPDDVLSFSGMRDEILENWTDEPFDGAVQDPVIVRNFKGDFHQTVYIALIPTDDWTTIPALLKFGGWNDCPEDGWHVAAFRYWNKQYGAELVCMSRDIVELRVKYRPEMLEDAVTLALEQYYYCRDIVDQGVDDPANLAKLLMQNDMWYFWWD